MKFTIIFCSFISSSLFGQNTVEVKCDSIYKGKGIEIKLENFDNEKDGFDGEKNSIFIIEKNKFVLIRDSIFSSAQKIVFADFNSDKFKDILVQNISDARSNWTYYLYLYNPKTNNFTKVKGFEEIKNPKYNPTENIVESYVVSAQNWVGFYKIKNHITVDLKIQIDNGESFDKDYDKAIKRIRLK